MQTTHIFLFSKSDPWISNVFLDPVSNIGFDPDSGFSPGKPVTCKANGYPRPTVHWIRTSDNVTVGKGSTLTVDTAADSYTCRATNVIRGRIHTVISSEITFIPAPGIHL